MDRHESGRLGGLATLTHYGRGHFTEIGQMGGRPRNPTLEEIQQRVPDINKGEGGNSPSANNLKELKALYASLSPSFHRAAGGVLPTGGSTISKCDVCPGKRLSLGYTVCPRCSYLKFTKRLA